MKVKELFNYLDTRFPPFIQENYDNSGKQVSFGNEEINGILLALDISEDVIDELEQRKYNVLVTHHPLLFKPLKHIDDEAQLKELDRWLAEEILARALGTGHKKGNFRYISFKQLREMGLPSLRHRRRLILHGHIDSSFFRFRTEKLLSGV